MKMVLELQSFLHVGLSIQWRHQQVAVGDDDLEDVEGRLPRVLLASTGECICTVARIQQDELPVSCRHVFVDGGNFLKATGWGEELEFVASSPHDDIIFLRGEAECSRTACLWLALIISLAYHHAQADAYSCSSRLYAELSGSKDHCCVQVHLASTLS